MTNRRILELLKIERMLERGYLDERDNPVRELAECV